MKFNFMKMVTEMSVEFNELLNTIENADSFDIAKAKGNKCLGFIIACNALTNSMICVENNDFTGDFGDVLTEWEAKVYNAMAGAAYKYGDHDKFFEYAKTRDEIRESLD